MELCWQKNAETAHPKAKRKLPSKLYNIHCKSPPLDPKLHAVLKENSFSGKMHICIYTVSPQKIFSGFHTPKIIEIG